MAGEPGNAPIDRILVRIGQVQHQIKTQGLNAGQPGRSRVCVKFSNRWQQETRDASAGGSGSRRADRAKG